MPVETQERETRQDFAFKAKMDNARNVWQLLKAVHFNQYATVACSENGLKVTVEDSKCVQANAFISASVFQEYYLQEEVVVFKINLTILIECLTVFGTSITPGIGTALEMSYLGYGSPLSLVLEEGGVVTDCNIKTLNSEDTVDFDFSTENVVNKIILKSEILREVWSDLDTGSAFLEIFTSPNKPYFRLSTASSSGEIQVDYLKDSDMIECFQCSRTQSHRYKISLLKPSLKALVQSSKTSLRMDNRGILCLQYMIKTEDGHVCFVEYFCVPEEDADDDLYV